MEFGLRFIGALSVLLGYLLWPIFFLLSYRKRASLPPIRNDLLKLSATTLAEMIRKKEVTSETLVNVFIERCKEVNPSINAIVQERFNDAIEEARGVDEQIKSGKYTYSYMKENLPLLGIPLTVKESCGLKGLSLCVGTVHRKGKIAEEDGKAVANLRKAGAIPIAVTNTPELCLAWETNNLITGRTNNPYNVHRTSGGSSGGEAALIASAGSVIGIGSDFAGSIRIPSCFCGIFGHKPSPGYVPLEGHYPISYDENYDRFLTLGPMARYAEDLILMMKVMVGERHKDLQLDKEPILSGLDIYYKVDAGVSYVAIPVDKEIEKALYSAVQYLETSHNCRVREADLKELSDGIEICTSVFLQLKGVQNLLDMENPENEQSYLRLYSETFKSILGVSDFTLAGLMYMLVKKTNALIPKSKNAEYNRQNEALKKKFNDLLADNGVFIYPTYPVPAFHHVEYLAKTGGVIYTMIFSSLGLPSTHVPLGLNSSGLPIGIQVIGAQGQDRLCLAVARSLSEKFGGWQPPPSCE